MSIVVFQHHEHEHAAVLGAVLQEHGHRLRTIHLHAGDRVPPDLEDVDGVISMGGPMNIDQTQDHAWIEDEAAFIRLAFEAGLPIVGVCLGAQLLAKAIGGQVGTMESSQVGWHNVRLAFPGTIDPLYAGIRWDAVQFHLHSQQISELPPGATPLAGSRQCRTQAFRAGMRSYGFQYHFEWTAGDIQRVCRNGLPSDSGVDAASILQSLEQNFPGYRRQGDRLCRNLAMLLLPIDKR